jgi:hypothetical protein
MDRQHRVSHYLVLAALTSAALACTVDIGGPRPPETIDPSFDSSEDTRAAWDRALAAAVETGQLTVLLNEAQLTAFLARRGADEGNALQSPLVLLREGAIQVYGVGQQGPLRANIHLTITPILSQDGDLGFELTSAEFGPLPLPGAVRESLSALLTEAVSGPLGTLATGVRITSVAIDGGELAIVGELR